MLDLVCIGNPSALLYFDNIYIILPSPNDGREMEKFRVPMSFL